MSSNTKIKFDKPFKTYDELIDILEERNVIITDKAFAKECLSNISYYALINGYKELYNIDEDDKFINPVPFFEFYYLYSFETILNNIIFKYIISIEKSIKSKISYKISENYGVYTNIDDLSNMDTNDYLCINNYVNKRSRTNILKKIKEKTKDNKNNLSINHYIKNHNHLPCWILINGISFGLTIQWYSLLNPNIKEYICNLFIKNELLNLEDKKEFFKIGLDILRKYRNSIAHGNRIFSYSIKERLPKRQVLILSNSQITNKDYLKGIGANDLFAVILVILTLSDETSKAIFKQELNDSLSAFNKTYFSTGKNLLEMLSLPDDFIDKLKKI